MVCGRWSDTRVEIDRAPRRWRFKSVYSIFLGHKGNTVCTAASPRRRRPGRRHGTAAAARSLPSLDVVDEPSSGPPARGRSKLKKKARGPRSRGSAYRHSQPPQPARHGGLHPVRRRLGVLSARQSRAFCLPPLTAPAASTTWRPPPCSSSPWRSPQQPRTAWRLRRRASRSAGSTTPRAPARQSGPERRPRLRRRPAPRGGSPAGRALLGRSCPSASRIRRRPTTSAISAGHWPRTSARSSARPSPPRRSSRAWASASPEPRPCRRPSISSCATAPECSPPSASPPLLVSGSGPT